ncbi:MAG: phosphate signaling complex protein PhoU [Acidobacteriota bacterium]
MSLHLQHRLEKIKRRVLMLGGTVEETLADAVRAIQDRDTALADRVIEGDERIDIMEVELEEECLATLALEQPVASDLRFLVAVLKMNSDLERIGDLAANLAEQARFLASEPPLDHVPFDLTEMFEIVHRMVKDSLDALVERDAHRAERVRATDDEVDRRYADSYAAVGALLGEDPSRAARLIHYLSIARALERVADHAVAIAEDVIYLVYGEIRRHAPPKVKLS